MSNSFTDLVAIYRRGRRAVFGLGPFLPIALIREKGWRFNQLLKDPEAMAEAALAKLDLGFESTTLPFDLNVEAEALGATVRYHDEQEAIPIYPTIAAKCVDGPDDVVIPADVGTAGRMPQILAALGQTRARAGSRGAVGAGVCGPFTLAGQVMDMDKLFVMTMKNPEAVGRILEKLTMAIIGLRDAYVQAGAQYIAVQEGGATALSPRIFTSLVLPHLQAILAVKNVPHALCLTGPAERFLAAIMRCGADAIGVDQACDLETVRAAVPPDLPLAAVVGAYDMLAKATTDEIRDTVHRFLDKGLDLVLPPADIYPPAKLENIAAFVAAVRDYKVTDHAR